MTLHEEQEKVQKALNAALSGLQDDPWLTQRVLAHTKGEKPVKKRISAVLVFSVVLGLSVIGTAYAMFSSQVAEFFGQYWNRELGESLRESKIAQIGESVTIGDVVFTLDEIAYKDRALYGVGTARPVWEDDCILPMDTAYALASLAEDPVEMLDPEVSAEMQSLVAAATADGGRMLTVECMPLKIGVDEGALLMPDCIGYYDVANGDGSVTFSFEASDGIAVNEGESYQILMESSVRQIDENGATVEGTARREQWNVSCVPAVMNTSAPADAGPAVIEQEGYELLLPAVYRETGTLPVYRALEIDFTAIVDPAWFNRSGVASGAGTEIVRFADHAELMLSTDGLYYSEFTDDDYTEAPSNVIVQRAWVRNWPAHRGEFTLEKTALTGITLEEARAQAKDMLARLGIDGNRYVCHEALDLSLERIRAMGEIWEQAILNHELLTDDEAPYDYASIPAAEEGYYPYSPLGVDTAISGAKYSAIFYITGRGIVFANIRNPYVMGEMVGTPETLLTPDEAVDVLTKELGRSLSRYDKTIKALRQVALTYESVRAENKADGMVFQPVWMIQYQDETAARQDSACYALVDAVNGALIDASFR